MPLTLTRITPVQKPNGDYRFRVALADGDEALVVEVSHAAILSYARFRSAILKTTGRIFNAWADRRGGVYVPSHDEEWRRVVVEEGLRVLDAPAKPWLRIVKEAMVEPLN